MSSLLIALAFVSVGSTALVVMVMWWCVSWARDASRDATRRSVRIVELQAAISDRDETLDRLHEECDRAAAAIRAAERVAHRATVALAQSGDAPSLVAALNSELRALAELSDVSRATARSGSDASRAVHGEIETLKPAAGVSDAE